MSWEVSANDINLWTQSNKHQEVDLFAVFVESLKLTKQNSFMAMINQHSWMFLSSYKKLREAIIKNPTIDTMVHFCPRSYEKIGGEVVQSVAFCTSKGKTICVHLNYKKLLTANSEMLIV